MLRATARCKQLSLPQLSVRSFNSVTKFTATKTGSAGGPFSQLPEFTPLQDSILVSLPSSCSIYTKKGRISAFSYDSKTKTPQHSMIQLEPTPESGFSKLSTGDEALNAMLVSSTPMSNVLILEFDDYERGWYLMNPHNSVMCFSGDLTFQKDHQLVGRGVVALCGEGPIFQMDLAPGETVILNPSAVLGYNKAISFNTIGFTSQALVPKPIRDWVVRYAGNHLDKINLLWYKFLSRDKLYCQATGPGKVLVQTAFSTGSTLFSDKDVIKAFK
ncbi:LADA_0E06678g1_1 [Lachancea dasiensis]|uniref:Altered inheritance of mitochondria protein 24, mitochondrial n=1 Tax=Lachancea dasiensis TaxID=1072105 RepID=A0A1G4JCL2_9SACH|nr:LADA_0E06678g1_1 [Lachancea dasiensis]